MELGAKMIVKGFSDYPEWISKQLLQGRFDLVCLAYRLPAVIYYRDQTYVIRTYRELRRVLATYQAILTHHRLEKTVTTTLNKPDWLASRFSVLVRQELSFNLGNVVRVCQMRFFVERSGCRLGINMVEVEELPFGKMVTKQRALRDLETQKSSAYA